MARGDLEQGWRDWKAAMRARKKAQSAAAQAKGDAAIDDAFGQIKRGIATNEADWSDGDRDAWDEIDGED